MTNHLKRREGQSLIEVVFSIGVIMVVMSGVVFLIISTLGAKTKSYDRKKAVEISQNEIEGMVQTKMSDGTSFWNIGSAYWVAMGQNKVNGDYTYNVSVSQFSGSGCSAVVLECLNAKVNVTWKNGAVIENFNRFFTKK